MTVRERPYRCVRCGADVTIPRAACNTCRASDPTMTDRMVRRVRMDYWRTEAKRLRILHRGQVPWAASGPPDDRRPAASVEVYPIDARYLPRRTA